MIYPLDMNKNSCNSLQACALTRIAVLPSAVTTASASRLILSRLNGWPYAFPCRRFAPGAADDARLGAEVVRYSFIVVDLHHPLLAGLPAHCHHTPARLEAVQSARSKLRWDAA